VELRRLVIERAANRCEYCSGLSQLGQEATFHVDHVDHVDHVTPVASAGETILDNLALACVSCSLRKAAREKGLDPETGKEVRLFNPRRDDWNAHFRWDGVYLVGLDSIGRVDSFSEDEPPSCSRDSRGRGGCGPPPWSEPIGLIRTG
jgi:hypothetical protein